MRLSLNLVGLYKTSSRSSMESDFLFLPRWRCGGHLLQCSNRFIAHSSYAIKLKLGSMIQDMSPHNCPASDITNSFGGAVWARLFKSSNLVTAYSSYPTELKFGRWYQIWICTIVRAEFFDFLQGGAPLEIFTAYSPYPIELNLKMINVRIILAISPHNLAEPDFLPGGAVGARLLQSSNRFTAYSSDLTDLGPVA